MNNLVKHNFNDMIMMYDIRLNIKSKTINKLVY